MMIKRIFFALTFVLLAGCAVQSTVTVFHVLPMKGEGKTVSFYQPTTGQSELELRAYQGKLVPYFEKAGYRVVEYSPERMPDYIAVFGYGIDNGTLVTNSSTTTQEGVIGYTANSSPIYGITGVQSGTDTERIYQRALVLTIFDAAKIPKAPASVEEGTAALNRAQVYRGRVTSDGHCSSLAGVIDEMLVALMKDFPGESGKARTQSVPWKGQC